MSLLTKLTVSQIQKRVYRACGGLTCEMVPNVSGLFNGFEADLIQITNSSYLREYEIKRSKEDFLADFKKKHFHDDLRIHELIYVLPDKMSGEWLRNFCHDNYKSFKRSFVFWFYHDDSYVVERTNCHYKDGSVYDDEYYFTDEMRTVIIANDIDMKYRRKIHCDELMRLYRLGMIKYWEKQVATEGGES